MALSVHQRGQSARGKSAEKSPQEEVGYSIPSDAVTLNELIVKLGDVIRKLKSEKAAKVLNYRIEFQKFIE
jgi:hypothetical protein